MPVNGASKRKKYPKSGANIPKSTCLPKKAFGTPISSILSMPVDKVLNNFFIDWGKLEKLSKGRFLSKFCYDFIHGLPKCLCFRQMTDFFRVNQVIHRIGVTLTITTNFINSLDIKLKNARFRSAFRQVRQRAGLACLARHFRLKRHGKSQETSRWSRQPAGFDCGKQKRWRGSQAPQRVFLSTRTVADLATAGNGGGQDIRP